MTGNDIVLQRLKAQHLVGTPFGSAEEVVSWFGAVQSQDYSGAKWALSQRSGFLSSTEIDQIYNEGKIVRTHIMRPTWHFVMPEDIVWMQEITKRRVKALMAYYDKKLEINTDVLRKTHTIIAKALRDGNFLTRNELAKILEEAGFEAKGQRLGHFMMHAELDAIICSGPLKGKQFTYALLEERAPQAKRLDHDEALGELTKRYFTAHGPGQVQDFAWWSGLTIADSKKGIQIAKSALSNETVEGKEYWFSSSIKPIKAKPESTHLLPNYDEYFIAFKDRSLFQTENLLPQKVNIDTILGVHIICIDGKIVGGWRRTIEKNTVTIYTQLLTDLSEKEIHAVQQAGAQYGKFHSSTQVLSDIGKELKL